MKLSLTYKIPTINNLTKVLLDQNIIYIKNLKNKTFSIFLNILYLYRQKQSEDLYVTLKNKIIFKGKKSLMMNLIILKLFSTLLSNKFSGVSNGFFSKIVCKGLGYKAKVVNGTLVLNLGFSHKLFFKNQIAIKTFCSTINTIILFSIEKQKLYEYMKYIGSFKKPDNYKGKGLICNNEIVRLKEGKKI